MKNTSNSKRKAYLEYIKQYCWNNKPD
jgi:hypothetical protein